jgi:aryl-alcohol dehydrogenase-like predicted oxidoreductase
MCFGSTFYGTTTEADSWACLDAARAAGINFLDTADVYGQGGSETLIGKYQRQTGHQFIIATKGSIKIGAPRGDVDNSRDGLRARLEASLTRLQVDSVALYYVHRRDFSVPIEEVTETLEGFRQEGLIGGFGFSEIAPSSLRRASKVAHVMAVQNEYSLWTRYPELGLIRTCAELGTAFVPFSPLARGMLTDTRPDPSDFAESEFRRNNPRFQEPNFSENEASIARFAAYARDLGLTTSALALAWVLDQGDHLIPIPGTRTADHLNEWAGASDIELTDDMRAEIDRLLPPGFAHGDRYSDDQIVGIERYC